MVRVKINEEPRVYFLYSGGYTEIGLEFSHRLVVLFTEPRIPLKDAISKYREILASFGVEASEEEIISRWIEV